MISLPIRSDGMCFLGLPLLNTKWAITAGSIGMIAGLILLSLGAMQLFGPVNSVGFISSLSLGCVLTAASTGLILLTLTLLRRSEYYPVAFNRRSPLLDQNTHQLEDSLSDISDELPSVPLKEIYPLKFKIKKSVDSNYVGPFRITTANVGMLPSAINFFQQVGHALTGLFNPEQEELLDPASQRVHPISKKFAKEANAVPILCCQEVFDTDASKIMAEKLAKKGYSVLHSIGDSDSLVNSGLLFATRYPINKKKVRFWKFTNLTQSDVFSSKGLLRIPIKAHLPSGAPLKVIIYTTHLQAQVSEKQVRKEQLEGILSLIEQDQAEDPERLIFLAGDLNISDYEYDGTHQNEYTENQFFFSQFYDFVQTKYGGAQGAVLPQEPKATFYKMSAFGTEETVNGCLYDRILFYTGCKKPITYNHLISIRTLMSNKLSDHLPVTLTFNLQQV